MRWIIYDGDVDAVFGNADGTMTRCAPYEPGVSHRSNARKASSSPRFP